MSVPEQAQKGSCRVIDGEKLPVEAGGAAALCTAVERAVAARTPNLRYSVDIRVASRSSLAGSLVANGRKLPELRFSVSDRDLNSLSVGRFADSVAAALADADKH